MDGSECRSLAGATQRRRGTATVTPLQPPTYSPRSRGLCESQPSCSLTTSKPTVRALQQQPVAGPAGPELQRAIVQNSALRRPAALAGESEQARGGSCFCCPWVRLEPDCAEPDAAPSVALRRWPSSSVLVAFCPPPALAPVISATRPRIAVRVSTRGLLGAAGLAGLQWRRRRDWGMLALLSLYSRLSSIAQVAVYKVNRGFLASTNACKCFLSHLSPPNLPGNYLRYLIAVTRNPVGSELSPRVMLLRCRPEPPSFSWSLGSGESGTRRR